MYHYIIGKLTEIHDNSVVLEQAGVGYEIYCTVTDKQTMIKKINESIKLYTHLVHREDQMSLYGFLECETKEAFLLLLKVSGIGVRAAASMLSHYNVTDLYCYIENENENMLKKIPGVGLKTAKKIILDLKDNVTKIRRLGKISINKTPSGNDELISAFINLGYKEIHIQSAIKKSTHLSGNFEDDFKKIIKILAGS